MGFFSTVIADSQRSLGRGLPSNASLVEAVATGPTPSFAGTETSRKEMRGKELGHKAGAMVESAAMGRTVLNDEVPRTGSLSLPVRKRAERPVELSTAITETTRSAVNPTLVNAKANASRIEKVAVVHQRDGDIPRSNHTAPSAGEGVVSPSPVIQNAEAASVDLRAPNFHAAASVNRVPTASVTTEVEWLAPSDGLPSENMPAAEPVSDVDDVDPTRLGGRSEAVVAQNVHERIDIGLPLSTSVSTPLSTAELTPVMPLKSSVVETRVTTDRPQVRIGQVNVTVEKRGVPKAQARVVSGDSDMASRNFLKGL